jgi:ribosomal protein L37E
LINVRSLGGKTADRHDSGCLACGAGAYMQHKDDCRARGLQTRVEWRNRVSSLTHERFAAIVESLSGK